MHAFPIRRVIVTALYVCFALCWRGAVFSQSAVPPPSTVDSHSDPTAPHGRLEKFVFRQSAIFPGTSRGGAVFIPAQYDDTHAACVFVRQDGYDKPDQDLLEKLIAAKEMPVTIGVFIEPGVLLPRAEGESPRNNRNLEYDSLGDKYVRFLTEELLPYVANTYHLKLSTDGKDRCIVGISSGGIAAFNAAWERPDAFSRVYSCSGSFSGFHGGNTFPDLIRKYESRPVRMYFTASTGDMENRAGSWYLLNQEMNSALKFAGYDASFHVVQGGHGAGYHENFAEAMRFLWKDWPAAVPAGAGPPRVRDVFTDDSKWELAATGCADARSPVCNSSGEVFFVDSGANKIYRFALDGKMNVFLDNAARANGLAVGPWDEIYTVSTVTGNLMVYDPASGAARTLASGVPGGYVLARPDGVIFITANDPVKGSQVWCIKDGRTRLVDTGGLKFATGLAYRSDRWLLAVADGNSKWAYSFQINDDGSLTNKERFFELLVNNWDDDAGTGSVCYAQDGQVLFGTRAGIQICALPGAHLAVLPVPDHSRVVGVALGGPTMSTLFACCGTKIWIWKRSVKLRAIGPYSPLTPVKTGPL